MGGEEFVDKPVALFNASQRATCAQAALTETITTMAARVVAEASVTVPLLGKQLDAAGIAAHPEISSVLRAALAAYARAIEARRAEKRVG